MPILAILTPLQPPAGIDATLHAPDGFLSPLIAAVMWAAVLVVLAVAVRRTNSRLEARGVLLMGVMGAFVFAAQMFNFQVIGGTSGHLLGGVLVAVLLGPWAGTLVMACVIAVQGLFFLDGGLLAMGANIFNMGAIGTLGGYTLYRVIVALPGGEHRWRLPAAAIAAWTSVVAGAAAMALQLGLSGTTALEIALPAMVGVHLLIGIGEAAITTAALAFLAVTRPDLLRVRDDVIAPVREGAHQRRWAWPAVGIAIAAAVVVLLAPLASPDPDGLERVAEDHGFLGNASAAAYDLLTDYVVPGVEGNLSTILAGLIGIAIVVPILVGIGRLLARPRS